MMENLTVYCDGGARGNPGPAAAAFVVTKGSEVLYKGSKFLGKTTNNVAEYAAVVMALTWISKNASKGKGIKFILDSELVAKQLKGEYKIKSEKLKPLAIRAKDLSKKISSEIVYTWLPRSDNETADTLVNETLDRNI